LLIAVLAIFVLAGSRFVEMSELGNPLAHGFAPILAAVPLMVPLFLGIETATEVGEEVRDAKRVIPAALALALALTTVVYLCVAYTSLGLLGPGRLGASTAPLIDAGRVALGRFALPLVLAAAVLALLKSLNAIFVVFSRYLFAMARRGALPAPLARVHPRWGTPYVAAAVAFAAAVLGLFLPNDLVFLFVAVSIPTVLKYLSTCASALMLALRRRELLTEARFSLSRPVLIGLASLGIVCAALIFVLGSTADWHPYVLMAVWGLIGCAWWVLQRRDVEGPAA
jgi:APA family basic amino acid/polyamine antiporter